MLRHEAGSALMQIMPVMTSIILWESVNSASVDHTHTQFIEESKMATALTYQTDVTFGEAYRK